jgi:membrane-associated phospholipid phosphatase
MLPTFAAVAAFGRAHALPAPQWLSTPLDAAIPFVPAAVWAYVSWYPSAFLLFLAPRDEFRRLSLAVFVAFFVCSVAHLLWPVSIARPALDGLEGASASVLRALYALDPPVSLFPSFHAAIAPILLQLRPGSRALQLGLVVWMAAICVSCVLVKQHYALDVLFGLVVGVIAVRLADVIVGSLESEVPRGVLTTSASPLRSE